jgi:2-polyprenyl-3-methyl-5-hydroxy-6-metoxy-1,4-benzoquinol methylase
MGRIWAVPHTTGDFRWPAQRKTYNRHRDQMWQSRRLLLTVACAALTLAQTVPEDVWERWVAWVRDVPSDRWAPIAQIVERYKEKLIADGVPVADVNTTIQTIRNRLAKDDPAFATLVWNKIYAASEPHFNTQPNEFLRKAVTGLKPGRALDIGMGQGRNTIFLAQQGWEVTGYDPAEVGIQAARAEAKKLGVQINAVVARREEFDHGSNRWDLIVMTYVFDKNDITPVVQSLKPDGILLIEDHYNRPGLASNELLKIFAPLQIMYYEETVADSDFNPTRSKRPVVRLLARKKIQ